ncbi:MAG TPA: DUF2911 domain-containing protein [Longimicrobiales bacterium]
MRSSHFRTVLPLVAVLVTASCARESAESWGFVATLGTDTTSVERITREGDRITSEAVGRSPLVVRRRWEATLAPDGSLRRWSMDTHIPNAPPGESDLHHEVDLRNGTIRLVRQAGSDTTDRTYVDAYVRTVPWNAFVYGTFELLFQAALGLPDSTRIGQYFFEGWSEGNLGFARVRRLEDGLVAITSTGLSGSGLARIDEQGRMLSYSGEGTTYKQDVRRITDVPDIDAIFERFAAEERAQGVSPLLSARDNMHATIGTTAIAIDYGRPLARGRTLLGGLIPYDRVWRTGANAATHLTIASPLRLGGMPLDSGTYTLWTLPAHDHVQLIINRQTGQWGTGYQSSQDIARVAMHVDTLDSPIEQFTIRVDTAGSRLVMEWGTFRWSAPIEAVR